MLENSKKSAEIELFEGTYIFICIFCSLSWIYCESICLNKFSSFWMFRIFFWNGINSSVDLATIIKKKNPPPVNKCRTYGLSGILWNLLATADPLFQQHRTRRDSIYDDHLEHISFPALWYHSWTPGICVLGHISADEVSLQKNDKLSRDRVILMIGSSAKDNLIRPKDSLLYRRQKSRSDSKWYCTEPDSHIYLYIRYI